MPPSTDAGLCKWNRCGRRPPRTTRSPVGRSRPACIRTAHMARCARGRHVLPPLRHHPEERPRLASVVDPLAVQTSRRCRRPCSRGVGGPGSQFTHLLGQDYVDAPKEQAGSATWKSDATIDTRRTSTSQWAPFDLDPGLRVEWRAAHSPLTTDSEMGSSSNGASRRSSGRVRHWLIPARHDDVTVKPLSPVRSMLCLRMTSEM